MPFHYLRNLIPGYLTFSFSLYCLPLGQVSTTSHLLGKEFGVLCYQQKYLCRRNPLKEDSGGGRYSGTCPSDLVRTLQPYLKSSLLSNRGLMIHKLMHQLLPYGSSFPEEFSLLRCLRSSLPLVHQIGSVLLLSVINKMLRLLLYSCLFSCHSLTFSLENFRF